MDFEHYFPIWDKLTADQQQRIKSVSVLQKVKSGTVLHDGSPECLGMLLVRSGQLRAYILSEEGREVTICRFFEMDICLFSASCVMPNMQFDIFIEAEKDISLAFRGSRNQRILDVPKSLAAGEAVITTANRWLGEY